MTYAPSDEGSSGSPARPDEAGAAGSALSVGEWRVDAAANELSRGVESVRLEPKAVEVLACLARRAGQVVSREELLAAAWPDVVVGDDALTQAIIKLRKALGDDARRPTYIETISKRGYRLIALVSPVMDPVATAPPVREAPLPDSVAPTAGSTGSRVRAWRVGLGAGLALAVAALVVSIATGVGERMGLPWPIGAGGEEQPRARSTPVIAVLPLSNQSGDPKRDYFSDGVTEDIIHALGRYSGLRVISRSSVEQFKHRPASSQAIKGELGVRYILKGSVREADGKLRIAVELSDAESTQVLWSERYEREGREVFEIQDRIVQNIVGTLAVKVTRLEGERAAAKPPRSVEAYDLVLRARALVVSSDRVANRQARALLARAREMAPDYADSHAVMAGAEFQRANFGWVEDAGEALVLAEQSALRALAIDDPGANARAHGQLGLIYAMRGSLDKALAEADRAIALNPSDAFVFDARGDILLWLGRLDEAIASTETALRLDPAGRSSGTGFSLALAYFTLGRHREALAAADAVLRRYPKSPFVHAVRAATLAEMGNIEEAREAAGQVRQLAPFFRAREFGNRFVDPSHMARLQDGLRKAGL